LINQIKLDPLRCLSPTSCKAELGMLGRTVRFETNSPRLLAHVEDLFKPYEREASRDPQFVWRIVIQAHPQTGDVWPARFAFSDRGLRYVHFGHSSFVAVDLERRCAIGFLSQGLAKDGLGLTSPFLDNLFCMIGASLGLTIVSAACVGLGEKALLVIAPPNNGKTTACYLAATRGLHFHSDRATFLEMKDGRLLGWGDFWPAAFRPEALEFLPELQLRSRRFRYGDFTFYYFDKRVFQPLRAQPITPVCCVFLQRGTSAGVRMSHVSELELAKRLATVTAFQEDDEFDRQRADVLGALGKIAAYDLAYGEDPADAADLFPALLSRHSEQ
jgi:hypothetical protein